MITHVFGLPLGALNDLGNVTDVIRPEHEPTISRATLVSPLLSIFGVKPHKKGSAGDCGFVLWLNHTKD